MRRAIVAVLASVMVAGSLLSSTGSAEVLALPSLTSQLLLDIARVPAPAAGTGLQIHADFPKENPLVLDGVSIYSLTADITPQGTLQTRSVLTSAEFAESGPRVEECEDPAFLPTGVTWRGEAMPIQWRFDHRSVPDNIKTFSTLATTRAAHRVWPQAQSSCTEAGPRSFAYDFVGLTGKNPKYDEVNMVDFGELGHGALAVNSTWYTSDNKIVEVDLRLNKTDYRWSNVYTKNAYLVKNVVAHELGHQIGLDDLANPHQSLTMFGQIGKGELNKVTLGRGDLRGSNTVSP